MEAMTTQSWAKGELILAIPWSKSGRALTGSRLLTYTNAHTGEEDDTHSSLTMGENSLQQDLSQKQRDQFDPVPSRSFSWHLGSVHLRSNHYPGRPAECSVTNLIQQTLGAPLPHAPDEAQPQCLSDTAIAKRRLSLSLNSPAMVNIRSPDPNAVIRRPSSMASSVFVALTPAAESFFDVFGVLGIPMIAAFLMSSAALLNQAYIQIYPAKYVNMVMNTADLDDGDFWMMPKSEALPTVVSTVILVFFAGCYQGLILFAVFFRHRALLHQARHQTVSPSKTMQRLAEPAALDPQPGSVSVADRIRSIQRRIAKAYAQLSSLDGVYNKYYNLIFDAPKLMYLAYTLVTYLRKGVPLPVGMFYAGMLALTWVISFFRFQRSTIDRYLVIKRLFYLMDIFFVVFAPLVVLVYAYYTFTIDRGEWRVRQETLTVGSFDRTARIFADPVDTAISLVGFRALVLSDSSSICIKTSLLLLSVYKWRKIITIVIQSTHAKRQGRVMPKKRKLARGQVYFGIAIYMAFGVILTIHTISAIVVTSRNCAAYPTCVIAANLWDVKDGQCPCLVYSNRKEIPRTWNGWIDAPDVTDELHALAQGGLLTTVNIVNRAVPTLPDTLRQCVGLKHITLVYTNLRIAPDWLGELTHLEYLHIEGDFTGRSLRYIPPDLFLHMGSLRYLHLGIIPYLSSLPSFSPLSSLQYLVLGAPHALLELPSFDNLKALETFMLIEAYHVSRLPSFKSLKELRVFNLIYRDEMCCNGYLTNGTCDLTAYQCRPRVNETAALCLNDTMLSSEWTWLESHTKSVICTNNTVDLVDRAPTQAASDDACGGVLFRRCTLGNATGICYNARMQVIYCDTTGSYERMRRLEIARAVGPHCDPDVEAWLGCTN